MWAVETLPELLAHTAPQIAGPTVTLRGMDRALHKLYSGRKELRKAEPAFLRGVVQTKVPFLALHELSKSSVDSLRSPGSETCRLPKIARQATNSTRASQTFR